jgi:hypothetical protein
VICFTKIKKLFQSTKFIFRFLKSEYIVLTFQIRSLLFRLNLLYCILVQVITTDIPHHVPLRGGCDRISLVFCFRKNNCFYNLLNMTLCFIPINKELKKSFLICFTKIKKLFEFSKSFFVFFFGVWMLKLLT